MKRLSFLTKELIGKPNNLIHFRCGEPVSFRNVAKGYYAQCPNCSEDLFSFEIEKDFLRHAEIIQK